MLYFKHGYDEERVHIRYLCLHFKAAATFFIGIAK